MWCSAKSYLLITQSPIKTFVSFVSFLMHYYIQNSNHFYKFYQIEVGVSSEPCRLLLAKRKARQRLARQPTTGNPGNLRREMRGKSGNGKFRETRRKMKREHRWRTGAEFEGMRTFHVKVTFHVNLKNIDNVEDKNFYGISKVG